MICNLQKLSGTPTFLVARQLSMIIPVRPYLGLGVSSGGAYMYLYIYTYIYTYVHTYTHVFAFVHWLCLRMFRMRLTPHDLAWSKVVQHLPHRTFLRNCTKPSRDSGSITVSSKTSGADQHCCSHHLVTSCSAL